VQAVLPVAAMYLEAARSLKSTPPSVLDLVLWERIATALKDPRAEELRNQVKGIQESVLRNTAEAPALSNQDLGVLATDLCLQFKFEEAHALYRRILDSNKITSLRGDRVLSSVYLGESGRGRCLIGLAYNSFKQGQLARGKNYLLEASDAFNRAIGLLSQLPDESPDKRTMLATCYMGLAKVHMNQWYAEENSTQDDTVFLPKMRDAHQNAKSLSQAPRIRRGIAIDLMNIGEKHGAIDELTAAVEAAPYMANELLPMRATCYGRLGMEDEMLRDISQVVSALAEIGSLATVAPKDLWQCAAAVGEYLEVAKERLTADQKARHLKRMEELLRDTAKSCASGRPYTPAQLSLNGPPFQLLKERNPTFCLEFEESVQNNRFTR
jgi:tetratricopeptide (TPR) repeat protein